MGMLKEFNGSCLHGGQGYGVRNESRDAILDFTTIYDLILTNTWFNKRDSRLHLITFKSGTNTSNINFILDMLIVDVVICKDCKVILGESVTTRYRWAALYFCIRK